MKRLCLLTLMALALAHAGFKFPPQYARRLYLFDTTATKTGALQDTAHYPLNGYALFFLADTLNSTRHWFSPVDSSPNLRMVTAAGDTTRINSSGIYTTGNVTFTGMALGTPTYTTIHDAFNQLGISAGRISGGVLSDAGSGKVAMTALKGAIKTTDSDNGVLQFFDLPACTTAALPDSDLSYIYVKLSGGVPKCTTTTSRATIHTTDEFTIGRGYRNGGTVDVLNTGITVANFERSVHERFTEEDRFDHASGSVITAATGLHLRTTAGIFHTGLTHVDVPAWSSDTANFEHYYWDSLGTWVEVAATASVDSMQYSDGSAALQTVGNNRYGVHWPYLGPKGKISMVYGSGSYTLPQADTASAPGTLPNYLAKFSVLVGKVIVAKDATSFTSVASAFATQFQLGTVVDHNAFGGLDGGEVGYYGHLTSAQHDTVTTGKVNAKTLQGRDTTTLVRNWGDSTLPLRADGVAARPVGMFYETDFFQTAAYEIWSMTAIASGTRALIDGSSDHPGILRFNSFTSANSGYRMTMPATSFLLGGAEATDLVVRFDTMTESTCFFGFHDASDQNRPVDGVYFDITGTTARGFTSSNSTRDSTASTYTLTKVRWYWLNVRLRSDAGRCYFTIKDSVGTQVFYDSISTQIPTAAGRATGHGIIATNSGTTAFPLVYLDYMNIKIARKISPGRPN